jgi:hypothetical protein
VGALQLHREAEAEQHGEQSPRLRLEENAHDRERELVGRQVPGDRVGAEAVHVHQQHAEQSEAADYINLDDARGRGNRFSGSSTQRWTFARGGREWQSARIEGGWITERSSGQRDPGPWWAPPSDWRCTRKCALPMVSRYHVSCSLTRCVKEKRMRRFDIDLPPIVDPHHILVPRLRRTGAI